MEASLTEGAGLTGTQRGSGRPWIPATPLFPLGPTTASIPSPVPTWCPSAWLGEGRAVAVYPPRASSPVVSSTVRVDIQAEAAPFAAWLLGNPVPQGSQQEAGCGPWAHPGVHVALQGISSRHE